MRAGLEAGPMLGHLEREVAQFEAEACREDHAPEDRAGHRAYADTLSKLLRLPMGRWHEAEDQQGSVAAYVEWCVQDMTQRKDWLMVQLYAGVLARL